MEVSLMIIKIPSLMVIITFVIMTAGCGGDRSAEKTITIGLMPDVDSIPCVLAEKNGYFAREGVKVKLAHFKSARDRDSALQSGRLDGVVSDMLAVIFANEGGIPLRIAAGTDGDIALMAGKNSGIKSMSDLRGKKVGLSMNTIMEYSFDRMLETSGINPGQISKVAIPQIPNRLEMLKGGKVDAAILPEPLAGLAAKDGARLLFSVEAMPYRAGVIAFTSKCLKENAEGVRAIFRAYNSAVEYIEKEPREKYIDFIIEAQTFPAGLRDSMKLPKYGRAGLPGEKSFTDAAAWMKAKKLIKGSWEYGTITDASALK
jgi:NitT/TauT family transport system substrate-binding protein